MYTYHLLLVSACGRYVWIERHGGRWAWPVCRAPLRLRPTTVCQSLLERLHVRGSIVSIGFGRPARAGTDWLAVLSIDDTTTSTIGSRIHRVDLETLDSSQALLEEQGAFLDIYRGQYGARPDCRPFEDRGWLAAVRAWVERSVNGTIVSNGIRQHRATPSAAVVELTTTAGRFFFKGSADRPFKEAALTRCLHHLDPDAIASTVAFDERRGWWLQTAARGRCLAHQDFARHAIVRRCVQRLGWLQAGWLSHTSTFSGLVNYDGSPGHLADVVSALFHEHGGAEDGPLVSRAQAHLTALDDLRDLTCLMHCDLAQGNIFESAAGPVFIDFDKCAIGPAPLAVQGFWDTIRTYDISPAFQVDDLYDAYDAAGWPGVARRVRPHAASLTVAAMVLRSVIQLESALRKHARGELLVSDRAIRAYATRRLRALLTSSVTALDISWA
jgi:Phosphotransferase enzyme family